MSPEVQGCWVCTFLQERNASLPRRRPLSSRRPEAEPAAVRPLYWAPVQNAASLHTPPPQPAHQAAPAASPPHHCPRAAVPPWPQMGEPQTQLPVPMKRSRPTLRSPRPRPVILHSSHAAHHPPSHIPMPGKAQMQALHSRPSHRYCGPLLFLRTQRGRKKTGGLLDGTVHGWITHSLLAAHSPLWSS